MYCETATFWVSYVFRASTFKCSSFARATFSNDVVFQNSEFLRGNLMEFLNLELLIIFVLEKFNKNLNFMLNFSNESAERPKTNLPLKLEISTREVNFLEIHFDGSSKLFTYCQVSLILLTRVKWVPQQLRTVMVWVLSSKIIIAQSDTITIDRICNCSVKGNKFGASTF